MSELINGTSIKVGVKEYTVPALNFKQIRTLMPNEYGFPGPERKKPAQTAKGASVFTLYKREQEIEK